MFRQPFLEGRHEVIVLCRGIFPVLEGFLHPLQRRMGLGKSHRGAGTNHLGRLLFQPSHRLLGRHRREVLLTWKQLGQLHAKPVQSKGQLSLLIERPLHLLQRGLHGLICWLAVFAKQHAASQSQRGDLQDQY